MMYLYERFKYELNALVRVCAIVNSDLNNLSYG